MVNPIQFLISRHENRVVMASPNDNWETIKFLNLDSKDWIWGSWEIDEGLVFSEVGNYKEKVLKKYGNRGNFIDSLVFEKEFIEYAKESYVNLQETPLSILPKWLKVGGSLILTGCTLLTELPEGLKVGCDLCLDGCTLLKKLKKGIEVGYRLDLTGCASLTKLPEDLTIGKDMVLTGCSSLTELPEWVNIEKTYF